MAGHRRPPAAAPYPHALRPTYYTVTEDDLLLSLAATFITSTQLDPQRSHGHRRVIRRWQAGVKMVCRRS
jgi:hypothetical protein